MRLETSIEYLMSSSPPMVVSWLLRTAVVFPWHEEHQQERSILSVVAPNPALIRVAPGDIIALASTDDAWPLEIVPQLRLNAA